MNYEEKYKEALERAKKFEEKYGGDYAGYIFPELAESEDERIRKELVAFFIEVRNREGNEGYWHDLKVANILAYLEKQSEEKFNLIDRNFRRGREVGYREGVADTIAKQNLQDEGTKVYDGLSIRLDQSLEKLGYGEDTEVKIIIVKQDDRPRD